MKGLYIHIPFCSHICSYCDFVKTLAKEDKKHAYVNKLIDEINEHKNDFKELKTIYIGGGTPSSLSSVDLANLLSRIKQGVNLNQIEEYTIECNPEDIDGAFIHIIKEYGINRVSLGVQSFNNDMLKSMNRAHDSMQAIKAVELLKANGISNINIDVIFAYPNQTLKDVLNDLDIAFSLDIEHLSIYSLILEEKSVLYHELIKNNIGMIDEDLEALMYNEIRRICKINGFNHYEISNFAKDGYESKHNNIYWQDADYLGLGVGAHSYIDKYREYHTSNIAKYISCNSFEDVIHKEVAHPLNDACMMGLRRLEGLNVKMIEKKYNIDFFKTFDLEQLLNDGLIEYSDPFLKLTDKGLLLGNIVFEIFLEV